METDIVSVLGRADVSLQFGTVDEYHFRVLIQLSKISNDNVINALKACFVFGHQRKVACGAFGVSQGYFSIKVRQIQRVNQLVLSAQEFY